MQKNKRTLGIIAAAFIVVLAVIIIWGIQVFSNKDTVDTESETKENHVIDLTGYNNSGDITIESAAEIKDESGQLSGYLVTVFSKAYNQSIRMEVVLDKTGTIIQSLKILDPGTADPIITQESFLSQFIQLTVPLSLTDITYQETTVEDSTADDSPEQSVSETTDAVNEPASSENTDAEVASLLKDGDYTAEADNFDEEGFKDKVTMSIKNGAITEVKWDSYNADGELKSVLSADGLYVLPEDGPTWQEQATAAADYVIQHQGVDSIVIKEDGRTDSIAGVSIPVEAFAALTKNCLEQAASETTDTSADNNTLTGGETVESVDEDLSTENSLPASSEASTEDEASGNQTDSISALIDGINKAGSFITEFVLAK